MQLKSKQYKHKLFSAAMLAALTFVFALSLLPDAFAQGGGGSSSVPSSGGAVKPEDANEVAAWDIRKKYFKRFPYAKYAGPTGKKIPDNPDGHDLVVEIGGGGAGAAEGDSGGGEGGGGGASSGPKKRESVGPGKRMVLAYDICHVHCNGVGHWLPGAEWYHKPSEPPCPLPFCYIQPKIWTEDEVATKRDEELFDTALGTYKMPQHSLGVNIAPVNGLPLSDTQFQIIDREDNQRFLELLFDPEHMIWLATNTGQIQGASAANSSAGAAEASFNNALHRIRDDVLINVANEGSGSPCTPDQDPKTNSQAVWMVMKMYKEVFLPMAILFLLPGAILTQVQSFVYKGFFESQVTMPFEGILRATIAIFLIPATQLIVSYSIDIGNSLSESVKPWANTQTIFMWSKEQSFNPPIENHINGLLGNGGDGGSSGSSSGGGGGGGGGVAGMFSDALKSAIQQSSGGEGQGKANDDLEKKTKQEKQKWLSQMMQLWFNSVEYGMAYALITLTAYQMVFICYLFLLGPLSACFFAWPSMQGASQLFREVFSKWTNAVINVSLWRFYWIVIMAVMTQRLLWLQDTGGINYADQWEMMVLTCFLGLMLVVPFNPFQFDPGSVASAAISKGGQMGGQISQQFQQQAQAAGVPQGQIQAMSQPMQQASQQMMQFGKTAQSGVNIPNQLLGMQQGGGVGGGLGQGSGGGTGAGTGGAGGTQPPQFTPQQSSATTSMPGTSSVSQPPLANQGASQSPGSQPPPGQGSSPFAQAIGQQSGMSSQDGGKGGPPLAGLPPGSASGTSSSQGTQAITHSGLTSTVASNVATPTANGLSNAAGALQGAQQNGQFPGSAAINSGAPPVPSSSGGSSSDSASGQSTASSREAPSAPGAPTATPSQPDAPAPPGAPKQDDPPPPSVPPPPQGGGKGGDKGKGY